MQQNRTGARETPERIQALVIDRDRLRVIDARLSNLSKSGCTVISQKSHEFPDEIGLQLMNFEEIIIARVQWRGDGRVGVAFDWDEPALPDSRRETRVSAAIPAVVSARDGKRRLRATITEASKSGCRIECEHLDRLQDEILIHIDALRLSIKGRIMWRSDDCAGVSLHWKTARGVPDLLSFGTP